MNCESTERRLSKVPEEMFFRETGVCRFTLLDRTDITGVSANTWEEYLELLKQISIADKLVVSPELITCTGMSFDELNRNRTLINSRIDVLLEFSANFPDSTFVLGTPLFVNEKQPKNSALLIKNREVVGATNKRSGATINELKYFELVPEEPPLLLPGTQIGLLICADLPTASLYLSSNNDLLTEVLRLSKREYLIGKEVECVHPEATSILVIACWGVGGQSAEPGDEDNYYRMQLRNIAWRVMRGSNIKEVVMVDRSVDKSVRPLNSRYRLRTDLARPSPS